VLTVCVYCASSERVAEEHRVAARELGAGIAARGWRLMYGGGNIGLMGEVARAVLEAGGHVTGVIPHLLADREVALEEVTQLVRTETMRERKALMDEGSDAFIVLPGGIGTLEELVEILVLKQLGYHDRVIVLLDSGGYWAPLVDMFERMVSEGLAEPSLLTMMVDTSSAAEALEAVAEHRGAVAGNGENLDLELETGDTSGEISHWQ
jgi:uncharacterized protein (TIGR00730 family)